MWEYDLTSREWTWVSGSNITNEVGSYGTKGIPHPSNMPRARKASISWLDASGNLWLFGGNVYDGRLNDLWKFDISTQLWTWVVGSNTVDQPGVYGTKGVPSPTNVPGARSSGPAR